MKSKNFKKAYAEFHGKDAKRTIRRSIPNPPERGFALGEVVAIVYRRPGPDERIPYEHKFKKRRPLLVSDARGRHLFFVGGDYTVTERGIVG